MEQMKTQIRDLVQNIDSLNREIAEHWSQAQKHIVNNDVDAAISILNAHFRLKTRLEQAETQLVGILKGYFSGQ